MYTHHKISSVLFAGQDGIRPGVMGWARAGALMLVTTALMAADLNTAVTIGASDVDSDPLTVQWTCTDRPVGAGAVEFQVPVAKDGIFEAKVILKDARPGTYTLKAEVSDGTETISDTTQVTVVKSGSSTDVAVNTSSKKKRCGIGSLEAAMMVALLAFVGIQLSRRNSGHR